MERDLREDKCALRARVLAARDRLPAAVRRAKSAAVGRRTVALPELARASVILCFASFRSEVDTAPIVSWCLARETKVALPRVTGAGTMEAFRVSDPAADLVSGFRGIAEPRDGLPPVDPATIEAAIVPGAAFDAAGGRIGYGGGFYDSFLLRLPETTPRIALAFDVQVVAAVPRDGHDLSVDAIVTESRVLRARRGG